MHQFRPRAADLLFPTGMEFNSYMKHKKEQEKANIVKMHLAGMSVGELSQKYNIPISTIYSWAKEYVPLKAKYIPKHTERQYSILSAEYEKLRTMYKIRCEFDAYTKEGNRQRLAFAIANRDRYSTRALCKALEISRASLRRYEQSLNSTTWFDDRHKRVVGYIVELFNQSDGVYGANRMAEIIKNKYNEPVSKPYVRRVMNELGYYSKHSIRRREADMRAYARRVNNLLVTFDVKRPNKVWLTDCKKYHVYAEGKYVTLCTIEDIFSRRIIAYAFGKSESKTLILRTVRMAVRERHPGDGLIIHSDGGPGYTSKLYLDYLAKHKIERSMSKPHRPKENAPGRIFQCAAPV